MSTKSKLKQTGRDAFVPDEDPEAYFDHNTDGWYYDQYLDYFKEGWNEAEAEYLWEQKQKEDKEDDWNVFSVSCPWNTGERCSVIVDNKFTLCEMDKCGLWYLKESQK